MNKNIHQKALKYVITKNSGKVDDLIREISEQMKDQFLAIGYIHQGITRNAEFTWKSCEKASEIYKILYGDIDLKHLTK